MPDPLRQTLSATQTPALFGASPYITRWLLLRHFIHGDPIDSPEHNRMDWGARLQPLLLAQAASDLHLEVVPNTENRYVRNGQIGCTRDAEIICPSRGPGALETKCVFDYKVWMEKWDGGKNPPRHIEIQLQQQMQVGDGENPYGWGVLAVWLGGEMHYFEREPIADLWFGIRAEAAKFFGDVEGKREGEPFGDQVELSLLAKLFEPVAGKVVDFRDRPDAAALANAAQMFKYHNNEHVLHEKAAKDLRAKFLALMQDASEGLFADGIKVTLKSSPRAGYTVKPTTTRTLKVFVPEGRRTSEAADAAPQENTLAGG